MFDILAPLPRHRVASVALVTLLVAGAAALSSCSDAKAATHEPPRGVRLIGEPGRQPGTFSRPRAVAVMEGDELAVIDRTGRVQVVDIKSGTFIRQWSLPEWSNGTPTGITADTHDNTLWIADTHYQRILHYAPDGTLLFKFGEEGNTPGKMVFPTDVCPDPDGEHVWVCEYGVRSRIMMFTRRGEFVREWGSPEYDYTDLSRPMAIDIDKAGNVVVADAGNHRIVTYDRMGKLLKSWGTAGREPGQLDYPYDFSVAPDGTMYIVEYGASRVSHFDDDGHFLGAWGAAGYRAGELFAPWGVTVDTHNRVVVADTNNGRLQVLDDPDRVFVRGKAAS